MLRNMKVRSKLVAMLLAPIIVLIGFAGVGATQREREAKQSSAVESLTQIAIKVNDAVHQVQAESGLSARTVAAHNKVPPVELKRQRKLTDDKIAAFEAALNAH